MLLKLAMLLLLVSHVYTWIKTRERLKHLAQYSCKDCPRVYVPVCGSDNRTYINHCKMHCMNEYMPKKNWTYVVRFGPCMLIRRSNTIILATDNFTIPAVNSSFYVNLTVPDLDMPDEKFNVSDGNNSISVLSIHDYYWYNKSSEILDYQI